MSPGPATLRRTPSPATRGPADPAHPCDDARVLPWPDHLDALEERLRRGRALFAGTTDVVDLPPLVCVPDGPLAAARRLRAAADLLALHRLEQLGERRVREALRGAAYRRY